MAIATKDMGTIAVAAGTLQVYLDYDDTTISSSSHIPTAVNCLSEIGEVVERIEDSAGVIQIADMEIGLKEDYTNYVEGVFYRIFKGSTTRFKFYLDEGDGNTYLFYGILQKKAIPFDEFYVTNPGTSGIYRRKPMITLLSQLKQLENTSVDDVVSLLNAKKISGTGGHYYLTIPLLIQAIMEAAFGTSEVDSGSIIFPSGDHDIQFYDGTNYLNIDDLYWRYENWDGISLTKSDYVDSTKTLYWGNRYANALELLGSICRGYGFLPRYFYGQTDRTIGGSGNKHRTEFMQRGRTGALLTFGNEKEDSELTLERELTVYDVYVDRAYDPSQFAGNSDSADFKISLDFTYATVGLNWIETLYYDTSGNAIVGTRYFDSSTGSYYSGVLSIELHQRVRKYYVARFDQGKRMFRRKYKGIKATNSTTKHTHLYPMQRTQIHDGNSNGTYYANEVRKNVIKNESFIEWFEE